MNRFSPLLRSINERLDLPQPGKSQILIEIATDMEDYYLALREKDVSEDEAENLVNEKFDFTDEALSELVSVHQTLFRKLFLGLTSQAQSRFEQTALLMTILLVAGLSGYITFTSEFILKSSLLVWPVITMTSAAVIFALIKSYTLYVKKDHNLRTVPKGLDVILVSAGAILLLGNIGYIVELLQAGYHGIFLDSKMLTFTYVVEDQPSLNQVIDWFMKSASLVLTCLMSSIVLALFWYVLTGKVAEIEEAEASYLLDTGTT